MSSNPSEVDNRPDRVETDARLQAEREKTDERFTMRESSVEQDAEQVLEDARERADGVLEVARQQADATLHRTGAPTGAGGVSAARASEDDAITVARAAADDKLEAERAAPDPALQRLLKGEREATDQRLLAERTRSDQIIGSAEGSAAQQAASVEALRAANAAAEASNTALEAFNYSVAHDLRSPIAAIIGFTGVLADNARLDPYARQCLGYIADSAREMAALVDALLELAHLTGKQLESEPVDLADLARTAVARLRADQPLRTVALIVQDELVVHGDPALLRSVVGNLLGNAWKFTGKIAAARIELGYDDAPEGRVYYVRDNGAGFDMAHVGALFTPFRRLHNRTEFAGTGIGLATVQRIVGRFGGRIWAEGAVGGGATFRFTLPDASPVPATVH